MFIYLYIIYIIYIYRGYTKSIIISNIRQPVVHTHPTTLPRQLTRNSSDHPAVVAFNANPGGAIAVEVRVMAGCW